jgi:8-oxo-dGTP pyrophosphatase MutT (NUDIX family)
MDKGNIISKRKVYQAKFFNVEEQEVEADDKRFIYSIVNRVPVVGVIPITDNNEVYLVSEYRYLFKKNILGLIGGHVDKGENVLETAKRELKEEVGIEALEWIKLSYIEGSSSVIIAPATIYIAKKLQMGESKPEEFEDIKLIKLPLEEAVKKVISGEINGSLSMIGILLLDELINKKI